MTAICQAWKDGKVSADTWLIGEDVWTPGTPGDVMVSLSNPTVSTENTYKDYYPLRDLGVDGHTNSTIVGLAFKLLVTGGKHPRNLNNVIVPEIGMDVARELFYYGAKGFLTGAASIEDMRVATARTAAILYGTDTFTVAAVQRAWDAVAAPGGALALTIVAPATLPGGEYNKMYDITLNAQGGYPKYHWKLTSGALPPGLALNPDTGLLKGTPTSVGAFAFTVQLVDIVGQTFVQTYSLTIGWGDATFTLTVARSGDGSGMVASDPAVILCGDRCSVTLAAGTAITLAASASTGSVFQSWSGVLREQHHLRNRDGFELCCYGGIWHRDASYP